MKPKVVLFLVLCIAFGTTLSGQKRNERITITGYLLDASKNPVADASILIDNKKTEVVTDTKGYYTVQVKPSAKNIEVATYVLGAGEEPFVIEKPIEGLTRIDFTLPESIPPLFYDLGKAAGEEEINIGYGTIKKKNNTGSVSRIDAIHPRYGTYMSIYDMLQDIPGVVIRGQEIQIHGPSSVNLSSDPLLIVDGTYVNSIDFVRPQFVKSIEVLKGSSASIYGSRGVGGVILIDLIEHYD